VAGVTLLALKFMRLGAAPTVKVCKPWCCAGAAIAGLVGAMVPSLC
jgi:hypothetical protein